ncbi:hypothetical protein IKQ26_00870 [bacterium]|nr:hypothetical protein [bacterium]
MKNSTKLLSGLFIAALCVSAVSIAETYTTTTTTSQYKRPVTTRTVTTTTSPTKVTSTTVDATTNPMYSVNRNDKIQQYQGSNYSKPGTTTTTTTKYIRPVTTRITTTTSSPTTVTSTTVDATTNPMYSVNRNDKIKQYQGTTKPATATTTTTTKYTRPVTTRTVTTTTPVSAKSSANSKTPLYSANDSKEQRAREILSDLQGEVQSELNYYDKLQTCTPASMNNGNLALKTYGMSNGLCSFDISVMNSNTKQMQTLCTFNAPSEAVKKFASDKLRYEKSLLGLESLSTDEYTAITNNLTMFTKQYCKQGQ